MSVKSDLIKEMELRLGGGMVDVELDPEHYELAIQKSFQKYRQRAENAVEESYVFLPLLIDVSEYTLPSDIVEVTDVYRRTTGVSSGTGNDIEPFQAAYINQYLLGANRSGGLASFDFLMQNRETMGRLFGAELLFTWRPQDSKLIIHRKMKANDECFLKVYNYRQDDSILTDTYAGVWIRDYAFAHVRLMLAEARGKFAQIAGPQGGTTMNADQLRTDAQQEIDKLEMELTLYNDGSSGLGFVIG
jgi:hypothetical protein|tara:strand:- start:4236 stop:4973 length:738 start_codon:yes stop_codon:yes gene_type:complete